MSETSEARRSARVAQAKNAASTLGGWMGMVVGSLPLLAATAESFSSGASGRVLGAGLTLVTCLLAIAGWGRIAPMSVGMFALVAFSGLVWGGVLMAGAGESAMKLLGQGPELWAPVTALGALVPPAILFCQWVSPRFWVLAVLGVALMGSGFYLGLQRSVPLLERLQGVPELSFLPAPHFQPAWICITVLFPVLGLILLPGGLFRMLRGSAITGRLGLGGAGLLLIPGLAGTFLLHRNLIPNTWTPLVGHLPISGDVEAGYRSSWDRDSTGDLDHTLSLRTRGFNPANPRSVTMVGCVRPPADPEAETRVLLSFRTAGGRPPATLTPEDLLLLEDGQHQEITGVQLVPPAARRPHIILGGIPGERHRGLSEATCQAVARKLAPLLPGATFQTYVHTGEKSQKIVGCSVTGEEQLAEALETVRYYPEKDEGPAEMIQDVMELVRSMGIKEPNLHVVLIFEMIYVDHDKADEKDRKDGEQDKEAEKAAEATTLDTLARAGIPVFLVGGGGIPMLGRLARVTGGFHVPGSSPGDWSEALERVRAIIDHDVVLSYRRKRPPPVGVEIVKPVEGQKVEGSLVIEVKGSGGEPYKVQLVLDEKEIGVLESSPWSRTVDMTPWSGGGHTLVARSLTPNGEKVEARRTFELHHPRPTFQVEGVKDGDVVRSLRSVKIVHQGRNVTEVKVKLAGKDLKSEAKMPPAGIVLTLDPKTLKDGTHIIEVQGHTEERDTITSKVTFQVQLPRLEFRLTRPGAGEKVFGQVPVQVEPITRPEDPAPTGMKVHVSGGTLANSLVGEVKAAPWLVPFRAGDLQPGPYTLTIELTSEDGTSGTTQVAVEVTRPQFQVAIESPGNGATVVEPQEITLRVTDEASLGLDAVEFHAGERLIEKRIQPPWTTKFVPDEFEEGVIKISARAVRKDDVTSEASVSVLVRKQTSFRFHVTGVKSQDVVAASLLLAQSPRVQINGEDVESAKFLPGSSMPLTQVIAFPTSSFSQESGRLPMIRSALGQHLPRSHVPPGLIGYSRYPVVLAKPGEKRPSYDKVLEIHRPEEGRALYDALVRGVELAAAGAGRGALVMIVDGADQDQTGQKAQSQTSGQDAIRRVIAARVELHVVWVAAASPSLARLEDALRKVARATGGSFSQASGATALTGALNAVAKRLDSQVVIEVTPRIGQLDKSNPKMTVQVPTLAGVELLHRHGLP